MLRGPTLFPRSLVGPLDEKPERQGERVRARKREREGERKEGMEGGREGRKGKVAFAEHGPFA